MNVDKRLSELESRATATDNCKTLDDWYRQFEDPEYKQEFFKKWYGNESE